MHEFMTAGHDLDKDSQWTMLDDAMLRRWTRNHLLDEDRALKWGEWPDRKLLRHIRWLRVQTRDKTIADLPKGIDALDRLEYLKCPYWFIKTMKTGALPASVHTLALSGAGSVTCPKTLVLRGIDFLLSSECALKFSRENFPDLRRLILKLDADAQMVEKLGTYESLPGIHLSNVNDSAVFGRLAPLSPKYVGVYIGKLARLQGIGQLQGLTELFLKNLPSLKTLNHVEEVTTLRELSVSYCNALTDVSAIGRLPNLRELALHDCPKVDLDEVKAIARKLKLKDPFIA